MASVEKTNDLLSRKDKEDTLDFSGNCHTVIIFFAVASVEKTNDWLSRKDKEDTSGVAIFFNYGCGNTSFFRYQPENTQKSLY